MSALGLGLTSKTEIYKKKILTALYVMIDRVLTSAGDFMMEYYTTLRDANMVILKAPNILPEEGDVEEFFTDEAEDITDLPPLNTFGPTPGPRPRGFGDALDSAQRRIGQPQF